MSKAPAEKKARRKARTIEEQIADLKAKQEAQAARKRERLESRYSETNAKVLLAKETLSKREAKLAAIEKEIEALDVAEESA